MIEVIQQQFNDRMSLNQKLNVTREFLQILILKIMSDKSYFKHLAFVGGTSLRILYDLRRFSEDLDFCIYHAADFDIERLNSELSRSLELYALPVEVKMKNTGAVNSLTLKFPSIMKELGISSLSDQKLTIKLEVDSNPPEGSNMQTTLVNKVYMLNITHYDLPSLFAGKLHACFFRKFTKGRDFYDLVWYLGRKVKPNLQFLNQAMRQTNDFDLEVTEENFKQFALEKIRALDFEAIKNDVARFLEDDQELNLLSLKSITSAIQAI